MVLFKRFFPLSLALLFCTTGIVYANYTIVLKNGRRITVKSYREEGAMIKVRGMGGEFGIAQDQIESIISSGVNEDKGMVVPEFNPLQPTATDRQASERTTATQSDQNSEEKTQQKRPATKPAKGAEEAEYLGKIKAKNEQLKRLTERYSVVTGGSSGTQSGILEGKEAIQGRTADLQSRLKDAQRGRAAAESSGTRRVDVLPQAYSPKEKELSELRKRIVQTQNERDALIREMQEKNFSSVPAAP